MQDLVSIIIPLYNGEKFICESIESCINQTYENIEIIVVNDGSNDNSEKKVLRCIEKYTNVKLVNIEHGGKVKAINAGFNIAKGNFIAIQAADDVCFKYRISEEIKLIKSNKRNVLIFGDMELVNENLQVINESYWNEIKFKLPTINYFEQLLHGNFISGGTMLINGNIKNKVFPIPEELQFEDWWIAFVCSYYGRIEKSDKKLIKYRQHNNNDNSAFFLNDPKLILERWKKITQRDFKYYDEFKKFIDDKKIVNRRKYYRIIDYNVLVKKLIITKKIKARILIVKHYKNNKLIANLTIKEKVKLVKYKIFGQNGIYINLLIKHYIK